MKAGILVQVLVLTAALSPAAVLGSDAPPLDVGQTEEPLPEISPPPKTASEGPSPEDFAQLEVRETDLVLTNISDRPFNAWSVKTVVRSMQGYEAYSTYGVDSYRSIMFPGGEEKLLQPGEFVSIEKGEKPWLHPDYRGPGAGVYYEIGALIFEGGESVGDPEVVDRIFESRLDEARTALKALEVTASANGADEGRLNELSPYYRRRVDAYKSRARALREIFSEAWTDYTTAVNNLRPQDLAELPSLEEVLP